MRGNHCGACARQGRRAAKGNGQAHRKGEQTNARQMRETVIETRPGLTRVCGWCYLHNGVCSLSA